MFYHYILLLNYNVVVLCGCYCYQLFFTNFGYDELFLQIMHSVARNSNFFCIEMDFQLLFLMVNRFLKAICIGLVMKESSGNGKQIGYEKHHKHSMIARRKYDRNYLNNCRFWLSRDAHQFRFEPRNLCGTNLSCLSFLCMRV